MPDGAPIMKVENTKNLGAEVCLVPGTYDDAHDKAVELQEETGMTFIHPYDDEQVIAGQGTIGLEILDQLPDLDAVIVPVGGGGLISGVAFAIKSLRPEVKVYGVQAEGAPSMYRSLHEHKYQTLKAASTFADGIQVKTPGELTYQICEQYVDDIVTVSEDETAAAILSLMENQKLVAEGAGAVPVAAVLFHKLPDRGQKVACVISGGNIDVNILNRVITRGLVMSGRKANMTIALEDKPGQLKRVAEIVSRCGSNVVSVQHDGSDPNMPISSCFLKLTLETRDAAQIEQIRAELDQRGLPACERKSSNKRPARNEGLFLEKNRVCCVEIGWQKSIPDLEVSLSFCIISIADSPMETTAISSRIHNKGGSHESRIYLQRTCRHRPLQPGTRSGQYGVCVRPDPGRPRHRQDGRYGGRAGCTEPGKPQGYSGRGRP